jgi:hypothetical protein
MQLEIGIFLFLSLTFFYLLIARVVGYCCIWSQSVTHTHSVGVLWTRDRPVAETSMWQHTTSQETSKPTAGFEPPIPASERSQTHALDLAATGIGELGVIHHNSCIKWQQCPCSNVLPFLSLLFLTILTSIWRRYDPSKNLKPFTNNAQILFHVQ